MHISLHITSGATKLQNGPDLYQGLSYFRQGIIILHALHATTVTHTENKSL